MGRLVGEFSGGLTGDGGLVHGVWWWCSLQWKNWIFVMLGTIFCIQPLGIQSPSENGNGT